MFTIRTLSDGDFLYASGRRVDYRPSPHKYAGFPAQARRLLVIHYTAGREASGAANWFANPSSGVSAHVTIGRSGEVIQSVPFSDRAWHAGKSRWRVRNDRLTSLNRHAIGIEIANAGACRKTEAGHWKNGLGVLVPSDEIVVAPHKNGSIYFNANPAHGVTAGSVATPGWATYTEQQMQVAEELATFLVGHYGLEDVVGHDDISPGRKSDPGPLFQTESFRDRVFGEGDEGDDTWKVRDGTPGGLAIRVGPGKDHEKVQDDNLAPGTVVEVNQTEGRWWYVTVLDANGDDEADGWVYSRYLERA